MHHLIQSNSQLFASLFQLHESVAIYIFEGIESSSYFVQPFLKWGKEEKWNRKREEKREDTKNK